MIRVALMSASSRQRETIVRWLQAESGIQVVGSVATSPFLRSLLNDTAADVVLIDLESDPDVREWLDEFIDEVAVVFLNSENDPSLIDRMRRNGSGAMLVPDASAEQIVSAIHGVAAGLLVFDGALLPRRAAVEMLEELTPRELDVLKLLAEGIANREIASRLNISENTIKFHISSILGKLGASSRTEAVSRGLRSGLIEL